MVNMLLQRATLLFSFSLVVLAHPGYECRNGNCLSSDSPSTLKEHATVVADGGISSELRKRTQPKSCRRIYSTTSTSTLSSYPISSTTSSIFTSTTSSTTSSTDTGSTIDTSSTENPTATESTSTTYSTTITSPTSITSTETTSNTSSSTTSSSSSTSVTLTTSTTTATTFTSSSSSSSTTSSDTSTAISSTTTSTTTSTTLTTTTTTLTTTSTTATPTTTTTTETTTTTTTTTTSSVATCIPTDNGPRQDCGGGRSCRGTQLCTYEVDQDTCLSKCFDQGGYSASFDYRNNDCTCMLECCNPTTTTTTGTSTTTPTTSPSPECTDRANIKGTQTCGCSYEIRCFNGVDEAPMASFASPDYIACLNSCDSNPSCGVSEYRDQTGTCILYRDYAIDEITLGDAEVAKRIRGTCSNSQCLDHNTENDPPPPPPPATADDCVNALPTSCANLANFNGFNLINPESECAGELNDLTGQLSDNRIQAVFDSCFSELNSGTRGVDVANCISIGIVCPASATTTTTTITTMTTTTTTTTSSSDPTATTCARNFDDPDAATNYCCVGFNYDSGLLIEPLDSDVTSYEECALKCYEAQRCASFTFYTGGPCGLFSFSAGEVITMTDNNPDQGDTDGELYDLACYRCATTPPPVLPTCLPSLPRSCTGLSAYDGISLIGPSMACTAELDSLRGEVSYVSIDRTESCFDSLDENSNGGQFQDCVIAAIVCSTTTTTTTATSVSTSTISTSPSIPTPTTLCTVNTNPPSDALCNVQVDYVPSQALYTFLGTLSKEDCAQYSGQVPGTLAFSLEWNQCIFFSQSATSITQSGQPGSGHGLIFDESCFTCTPGTPGPPTDTCTPVPQLPSACTALRNSDFVYEDYTNCLNVLNAEYGPDVTTRVVSACGAPVRGAQGEEQDIETYSCIVGAVQCP